MPLKDWLNSNSDLLTNCLDFMAFLLVTPDIIGKDRLERLRVWLEAHSFALPGVGRPGLIVILGAMALSILILASGRFLPAAISWSGTLIAPWSYLMKALTTIWGGLLIALAIPAIYTIGAGLLYLIAELLRLTIIRWEISGIMLALGTIVFASSRALAIWHATNH